MSWLFVAKGTIHCRKSFTGKWCKITTVHQNYTVREYMSAPLHRYDINYTGQQLLYFFLHQRCKFFLMNEFHWFQICPGFWFSQYIIIYTMDTYEWRVRFKKRWIFFFMKCTTHGKICIEQAFKGLWRCSKWFEKRRPMLNLVSLLFTTKLFTSSSTKLLSENPYKSIPGAWQLPFP